MWQENLVSAAKRVNECLDEVYISGVGPSFDDEASNRPDMAGTDVS